MTKMLFNDIGLLQKPSNTKQNYDRVRKLKTKQ